MGRKKSGTRSQMREVKLEKNEEEHKILCMICGKGFTYEHKMKVHLRTHTGETPYSCSYCNKAFAQNAALKVHIRTHTGERPFSCETCEKTFSRADHLNQHRRTHTGETPYKCLHCNKSYATWSAVSRHRWEHAGKDFNCKLCSKTFSRSDNLRSHVIKCHPAETAPIDAAKAAPEAPTEAATEVAAETAATIKTEPQIPKEDVSDLLATLVDEEQQYEFGPHFLVNGMGEEEKDVKASPREATVL